MHIKNIHLSPETIKCLLVKRLNLNAMTVDFKMDNSIAGKTTESKLGLIVQLPM